MVSLKRRLNIALLCLTLLAALMCLPVAAQTFDESLAAYGRQDYQTALRGFRRLAEQGSANAQYNLGVMYSYGRGVPKNEQQAFFWTRKAAEQGFAPAQFSLGWKYANGEGVPKDEQQAVFWYRKAAEQGQGHAQHNLGSFYIIGRGVPRDEQQGYFWLLLASAQGLANAIEMRDLVEGELTPQQRAAAQSAARDWKPRTGTASSGAGANLDGNRPAPRNSGPDATGSGFRITKGLAVTNQHVVAGCQRLAVNGQAAHVRASDERSDLALLNGMGDGPAVPLRGQRVGVGEAVSVAGYPLRGLLSGFNLTTGNISSLSGIGGDTRFLQITAPVQPGNSGGPLLDSAGNLAGVVVSKLDAIQTARITGDIPQNVNFAINVNVLRAFLDANNVDYATAGASAAVPTTTIAERARVFTVLVECWK